MLCGSIVALVTPFNSSNEVNYDEIKRLCMYHLENDTNGLVLLGTTAEASTLSKEEKRKIVCTVLDCVKDKIKVCVGIISNTLEGTLDLYDNVKDLDFDSYLVIDPYYIKSNDIGLIKYFTIIADRVNKPIILYSVPKRTGEVISLDVLKTLKHHPNVVGIKDAGGDFHYHTELIRLQDDSFSVYSGDDLTMLASLGLGSRGVINVIGNAFPKETSMIINSYKKDSEKSKIIYFTMLELMKSIYLDTSPIGIKYLMYLLGYNTLKYRLPLGEPRKYVKRQIESEILKYIE